MMLPLLMAVSNNDVFLSVTTP